MANFEHKCFVCEKTYNYAYNLNKHIRNKHLDNEDVKFDYRSLVCTLCNKECISKKRLEEHLASVHNCILETDVINFFSYDDFLAWKADVERKNSCSFVKSSGKKALNGVKTTRFYCHRSGYFTSKGTGKRSQKSWGSNKINGTCPALLKVEENDSGISVKYVKTHLGHENDIRRLALTKEERFNIAVKLVNNTPIKAVLDEVRSSATDRIERINLLTRRDILNIKKEFNLSADENSDSSQSSLICDRHDASLKLSFDSVLTDGSDEWLVSSETSIGEVYRVKRYAECSDDCAQLCKKCKYCLHNFVCTCADSAEQWNMCQHIHLICQYISRDIYLDGARSEVQDDADNLIADDSLQNPSVNLINDSITLSQEDWEEDDDEHLKNLSYGEVDTPIQQLKNDMLSLCYKIEKKIQGSDSITDLKEYRNFLKVAYSACKTHLMKENHKSDNVIKDLPNKMLKSSMFVLPN